MECPNETVARLFYNSSSSFLLLFLFIYASSVIFANICCILGGDLFYTRKHDENIEDGVFSDEEEDDDEYYRAKSSAQDDHLVANIIHGGETLKFLPAVTSTTISKRDEEMILSTHSTNYCLYHEEECRQNFETIEMSVYSSPVSGSSRQLMMMMSDEDFAVKELQRPGDHSDACYDSESHDNDPIYMSPIITMDQTKKRGKLRSQVIMDKDQAYKFRRGDENYILVYAPSKLEYTRKIKDEEEEEEEIFVNCCTNNNNGSITSKRSSSINCYWGTGHQADHDDDDDHPFSSSPRRNICPNWKSQMFLLDKISAQYLSETESRKLSIQACPRSISERNNIIVHSKVMATARNKRRRSDFRGWIVNNPYDHPGVEAAYVAQICLTWEALNWNYKYLQRLRDLSRQQDNDDPGCPAYVAQQFQQFQVLLLRYIENEPFQCGRRPEIFARMRSLAPKLLQVPQFRESKEEEKEEGCLSRISSDSFLVIVEEAIRTFMSFLKADKENHYCQLLASFFTSRRNRSASADPTLHLLLKKITKQKKMNLKDLKRSRKCMLRKIRKIKEENEEEMEMMMAHIDLKVVSRVLRMSGLNDEQLHWCEDKMSKVRISHDGKLLRDSSPLFFPARYPSAPSKTMDLSML